MKQFKRLIAYFSGRIINMVFGFFIRRYKLELYLRDRRGLLVRREASDNFQYIFRTANACDAYPMMDFVDSVIDRANVSLDVGANIGITSIWLAAKSKKVYCFEPEPENRRRFTANIAANNINNVQLFSEALSDRKGVLDLYIHASYGHHSLGNVKTSKVLKKIPVKINTIDCFCAEKKIKSIDILKIDVEGFEYEVLAGASRMLERRKINCVVFEVSKIPLQSLNKSADAIFRILEAHGFAIFGLDGKLADPVKVADAEHADLVALLKGGRYH